jgi:hypothetical protein
LAAYLTCRWVGYTGVLRGRPRLPDVVRAGFGSAFRDLTCVVDWAALDLRLGFDLTGAWASFNVGVDLARKGLALGEGCSAVNEEGAIDGLPINPRTSITSRLNIIAPY